MSKLPQPNDEMNNTQTSLATQAEGQASEAVCPKQLSIVIACYNEASGVGLTLDRLLDAWPEAEILVVNDGSTDSSRDEILKRPGVRLCEHPVNRGQGASLCTGCRFASREYVLWYDADGQHEPKMVGDILSRLANYDCVIGARTSDSHVEMARRPGKAVLRMVAKLLTNQPIYDLNSGLRAFRKSVLAKYLHLLPSRFSASTVSTILMLERGYRVGWVPITTPARVGKSSVSQITDGLDAIMLMIHLVQLFRPLRFYMPISITLFLGGLIYGGTKAIAVGQGIPTSAVVLMLAGIQTFFFGLIADQLSAIRKERFEKS